MLVSLGMLMPVVNIRDAWCSLVRLGHTGLLGRLGGGLMVGVGGCCFGQWWQVHCFGCSIGLAMIDRHTRLCRLGGLSRVQVLWLLGGSGLRSYIAS